MRMRLLLGVAVAMIASVATTLAVLAVAGNGDPQKVPATDALKPEQIVKLPSGTMVPKEITTPGVYDQFRIMPAGSVPQFCDPPGPAGGGRPTVEIRQGKDGAGLESHALKRVPSYVPAGWSKADERANTIHWTDGSASDSLYSLTYERATAFPIHVDRFLVNPSCLTELVSYANESAEVYTLTTVAGQPAVIQHQAPGRGAQVELIVYARQGNVLTVVRGRAIDLDDLVKMAGSVLGGRP